MAARQITHEANGLKAVLREKLGSDVLDASIVHNVLAEYIAKQIKVKDISKLPTRFWSRILFVTNIMQQTVSLEGDDRFDIPTIDASEEDMADFYEFLMGRSEETINFFRDGFRKFDTDPNLIGASSESTSAGAPVQDSSPMAMS